MAETVEDVMTEIRNLKGMLGELREMLIQILENTGGSPLVPPGTKP